MKFFKVVILLIAIILSVNSKRKHHRIRADPVADTTQVATVVLENSYDIRISIDNSTEDACVGTINSQTITNPTGNTKVSLMVSCTKEITGLATSLIQSYGSLTYGFPYRLFSTEFTTGNPPREKRYIQSSVNYQGNNHLIKFIFDTCLNDAQHNALVSYLSKNTESAKSEVRYLKNEIYRIASLYASNRKAQVAAEGGKATLEKRSSDLSNEITTLTAKTETLKVDIANKIKALLESNKLRDGYETTISNLSNEYNSLNNNKNDKVNSVQNLKVQSSGDQSNLDTLRSTVLTNEANFRGAINTLKDCAFGDNAETYIKNAETGFTNKNLDTIKNELNKINA